MAGPNYNTTSHNHRPVLVVRSKSCHGNVSRSVGLPKQQRSAVGNHGAQPAYATWASRRYKPVNRRPISTSYPLLRSWNSEGLTSRSMTTNMAAAAAGLSSARPQVQSAGNSGEFYQERSKTSLSTKNASELKSCNLSAKTGNRSSRSKSTPRVYPAGREISSHVYISDGLLCRDLAIRSLASNPKLRLGQRQRSNGLHDIRPRPKSLPTDLELETILPVLGRLSRPNVFGREETVVVPSKEGYHPRSKSPTYRTLMQTKEVLVLELSKKLREIRRDLGGIKARENSAAFSEGPISPDTGDAFGLHDWYIKMIDVDLLQDDEAMVPIGEPLNSEDVDQSESLPLGDTAPAVRLKFSAECLRAHINDGQIIRMDVDEVEKRITARRNKELSQKKKVWDVPIGTPPELSSRKRYKPKKITWKSSKQYALVLPQVSTTKFKVSKSSQGNKDVAANHVPPLILVITEKDLSEKPVATPVKQPEVVEQQQSQQTPKSPEINNNIESEVRLEKTPLISEIVSPEKQTYSPEKRPLSRSGTGSAAPVRHTTDLNELSQRLLRSSIKPKVVEKVVPPAVPTEKKKPLTEKEKFLMMRKRMEERKAAQSKKKESFRDISMLGLSFDKQRERRGKLGHIIASKIDGMLAFGDDDEDDDDDDDDDSSMIDTDEEPELKNLLA